MRCQEGAGRSQGKLHITGQHDSFTKAGRHGSDLFASGHKHLSPALICGVPLKSLHYTPRITTKHMVRGGGETVRSLPEWEVPDEQEQKARRIHAVTDGLVDTSAAS